MHLQCSTQMMTDLLGIGHKTHGLGQRIAELVRRGHRSEAKQDSEQRRFEVSCSDYATK